MAEETVVSTYEFEAGFEQKLLAFLLRDRQFFAKNQMLVEPKYLGSEIRRDVWTLGKAYLNKYSEALSYDILCNEVYKFFVDRKKKDIDIDTYYEEISEIFTQDVSAGQQYATDKVVEFARNQAMIIVLRAGAKKIMNKQPLETIATEAMKALSIGGNLNLGYDYFEETVTRTTRHYDMSENVVGTGYKRLNKWLGGGLAGGELGLVVGPPNRGKTAALINLAVGAMLARKNVIYFGLEGAERDVAIRFDMRISRIDKDHLQKGYKDVQNSVSYFHKLLKSTLIIKMYAQEEATVNDLDQYLTYEEMARGFKPDVVFIDYLNLCRRSNSKEDMWLGRNYREGKSFGTRRNLPVWSAVQAKMEALKGKVVEPHHIAEATGRVWADADVIIGLCQSDQEKEMKPMGMRWFLGKNRNRPGRKTTSIIFDNDLMLMEEDYRVAGATQPPAPAGETP